MSGPCRVLLVSPVFHDYWRSIARGFEANGYQVVTHCYDEHAAPAKRIRNKIVFEGLDKLRPGTGTERFVQSATAGARAALHRERPDAVVVVKGDLLGDAFWDDVTSAGLPHVLWLYDELRRTRHTLDRLGELGAVASYSPLDVHTMQQAGIMTCHVPLAFDPAFVHSRIPSDDVVFIGARYPGRTSVLEMLVERGLRVRAYGDDWSHRWTDRVKTWEWYRPSVPGHRSVARGIGAGLMAGAAATLNIHGDQDGFTMRTFEAAGVGALELIDRDDVALHYDPDVEVLVFSSVEEIVELVGRASREPLWAAKVRAAAHKRTLAEHTFAHRAADLAGMWN